jgi:hypothetical protein
MIFGGRTVHLVGNGHRFYGNIECESAADLQVGDLLEVTAGVLENDPEWELCLAIVADADMGRSGREHIRLRFTDRSQAESVRQAFIQVAALVQRN